MSVDVDAETFELFVAEAVAALPTEFASRIENVVFSVEAWATGADVAAAGATPESTLLGVYRGVPLTRRGRGYNMATPDRIVIFSGPLQELARSEQDLRDRVARVVRHEVAHYFGISDDRLRELEAY